jgi:hypothetical protein
MLRFSDNTQVLVVGLAEILADLHSQGRQVNRETAEEIINRLEANKNYIPSSDRTRKEFAHVLLKEYEECVNNNRIDDDPEKVSGKG